MSTSYNVNELKPAGKMMIHAIISAYAVLCVIPFILVVAISVTDEKTLGQMGYSFLPTKLSIDAYRYILTGSNMVIQAYGITILTTVLGTILGLLVTSLYAYAISRKDFKYGRFFTGYAAITMLFNGGLVPWYLVCTKLLHLNDTFYALIIPYLISAFYVIIMKAFFQSGVPDSIIESAKLDGAGEFRIFFSIVTRISLPAFATVGLFLALSFWNDWWLPMMFIEKQSLVNLQFLLYRIQNNMVFLTSGLVSSDASASVADMPAESARMAMAVLATGPIILAYPFVQKYFVKGLTLGAVKG
ncbi:carbohydrate ABC transporter permease [Paenibacillus roseipurpureus]|uniref:Carbohydrate ABC transporter permease n=1 Tax=Paenibacillus roseopurpureus TaxID=2918901 RepID=A0AA96LQ20_9BACL|nr:carbohydrate ABC transporter permease [Paenibacillus sp. MBLB1832]WNR44531.1 carbohydrate ABC transporter permease [Paenibacillus sp. MBLB1832]